MRLLDRCSRMSRKTSLDGSTGARASFSSLVKAITWPAKMVASWTAACSRSVLSRERC